MLMETLEREVGALNAEVARLRFMVYHMRGAVCSSVPPSAEVAPSSSGRCNACGSAAEARDSTVPPEANSGGCRALPPPFGVLLQELTQTVAQLVAASKEVGMAASALGQGREGKSTECLRRRGGREKRRKAKKHRHRHRHASRSSSALSSLSSSSSSASSSLAQGEGKKKERSHRHAEKKRNRKDLRRHRGSTEDRHNGLSSITPHNTTSQANGLHTSNAAAQWNSRQRHEEEEKSTCVEDEGNAMRSSLRGPQRGDDRFKTEPPAGSHSAERSRPPSVSTSHGMLASAVGPPAGAGDQGTLASREEQSSSAAAIAIPPRMADTRRETNRGTPLSTDENGYPLVTHGAFSLGCFTPAKTNNVTSTTPGTAQAEVAGEKGKEGVKMELTPLHAFRTPPAQRRSLLDRFRGGSDESSVSDGKRSMSDSLQQAGTIVTPHSTPPCSVVNYVNGIASADNVSRNSLAIGVARASTPSSFGRYGLEMIEEYGFALNDSFPASENAGNLNSQRRESSPAILTRNNAMYHLRDSHATD